MARRGLQLCQRGFLSKLSHVDAKTNLPGMVDVTAKAVTSRVAQARGEIVLPKQLVDMFAAAQGDLISKKGPVMATAIVAGTMGVKKTWELIPLCHPIAIEGIKFNLEFDEKRSVLDILCTVRASDKTGVEMEALTGVSVAALTVYDMCKAVSHDMVLQNIRLVHKTGGKSDVGHLQD